VPGSPSAASASPAATRTIPGDGRRSEIMEPAQARALVRDKTDKEITFRHLISV